MDAELPCFRTKTGTVIAPPPFSRDGMVEPFARRHWSPEYGNAQRPLKRAARAT